MTSKYPTSGSSNAGGSGANSNSSNGNGNNGNGTPTKPRALNVKLVLLGEASVGKSSLVARFVNNEFQSNLEPTIGAAFMTQKCDVGDRTIKFEIWDTAGQERFHSLAPMYYRNAQAAVVVYDITNKESLSKAKSWIKELQRQANPNIVIALAGNKVDLANKREVETEEGESYATESGLLFYETSAKDGSNVNDLFQDIAKKIPWDQLGGRRKQGDVDFKDHQNKADPSVSGCSC